MAFGLDFLSGLGGQAVDFAAKNPALTGGLLGAGIGGLADGGQGALLGGLGGAALGFGGQEAGLFGSGAEELSGSLVDGLGGSLVPQKTAIAQGLLPSVQQAGQVAQPFSIGGLGLEELGALTSGAGDIYSTINQANQSQDLIDLQKQAVNQGLLQSRQADERRQQTQENAAAGFSNYYLT